MQYFMNNFYRKTRDYLNQFLKHFTFRSHSQYQLRKLQHLCRSGSFIPFHSDFIRSINVTHFWHFFPFVDIFSSFPHLICDFVVIIVGKMRRLNESDKPCTVLLDFTFINDIYSLPDLSVFRWNYAHSHTELFHNFCYYLIWMFGSNISNSSIFP